MFWCSKKHLIECPQHMFWLIRKFIFLITHSYLKAWIPTVNYKIFVRILFSRIALKDIFGTLKIRVFGMIYLHQCWTKGFRHFANVLFSQNTAYAKFRENKTLGKIYSICQHGCQCNFDVMYSVWLFNTLYTGNP